jgi:hypothetical protein
MEPFSKETLLAKLIEKYRYLNDKDATARKVYDQIIESYSKIENHVK